MQHRNDGLWPVVTGETSLYGFPWHPLLLRGYLAQLLIAMSCMHIQLLLCGRFCIIHAVKRRPGVPGKESPLV